MPLNKLRIQQYLRDFNLRQLFIEELGWDNPPAATEVTVEGQRFALSAIAHKRGMVAYQCPAPDSGRIPEYALRRKIEQQVIKTAHEHLIVFTDPGKTTQVWQWVKREPGKPAACREHTYHKNQSGEALIQKLQTVAFSFDEEESLTLGEVTSRTRKGFDVERVTKRFYEQFKKEHASFLKFVEGIDAVADREWYASVMLNRLMFVYFVQRKGFLDNDPHYLRNRLRRCQAEKGRDKFHSFYRYFLLRLFHEGLGGKARPRELQDLLGRIPYLNGGFFEKHVIEQRWENIEIRDKAFERIFDYFDHYQWHLDERPLRADNEINPDVLGFIFEKYINQKQMGAYYTQEDITGYMSRNTIIPFLFDAARKACKAAFDLPAEASTNDRTEAGKTAKAGGDNSVWKLLQSDPDRYIYPAIKHGIKLDIHSQPPTPLKAPLPLPKEIEQGVDTAKPNLIERRKNWNKPAPSEYALPTEIWREVVARRQRYEELRSKLASGQVRDINDLVTLNLDIVQFAQDVIRNCDSPELLRAFWHALKNVSVLDPTVGSGAFLFAALNILKPLYEACLERMEAFVGDLDRSGEKHRPEKMSDFRAVLERVDADYFILKSIVLNNLYGVDIMEEATEICKLRLFLKLAAQVEPDLAKDNFGIEPLPDIDFNIRAGNTLVGYATADEVRRAFKEEAGGQGKLLLGESSSAYKRFEENVELADRAFRQFREMQTERGMDSSQFASAKVTLRKQMKALEDELNRYLASDYGVKVSDKAAYAQWLNSHLPFHWFVEFYGIVNSGGFDVIIGNPPYVEYKEVKKDYRLHRFVTEDCGNLYAFTWERSVALARKSAHLGLIIPVASVCTDGYSSLQKLWVSNGHLTISDFNDRPGKLFDCLEHIRLAIVLLAKDWESKPSIHTTTYNKWFSEARGHLFERLCFTDTAQLTRSGSIPKVGTRVEASVLAKLASSGKTLQHYASASGRHRIYYTRKLSWFVQILDFVPSITDGRGRLRDPSELKEVLVGSAQQRDAFLCVLNSSLFYWLLTVWSDCRNLNKREVLGVPLNFDRLDSRAQARLTTLAEKLMKDFREHSQVLEMNYENWGTMNIQCIYPKFSKSIIDEIDTALAEHYGFTEEELDFILNYDIKFRLGLTAAGDDE